MKENGKKWQKEWIDSKKRLFARKGGEESEEGKKSEGCR
jgi:hypothetical protein